MDSTEIEKDHKHIYLIYHYITATTTTTTSSSSSSSFSSRAMLKSLALHKFVFDIIFVYAHFVV